MAIIATNNGNDFVYEPVPAGTYAARCISMVEIGTVEETFQGENKRVKKVRFTWELPTETKVFKEGEGERPYSVSKEFTLSMHEKANLRKTLEGWRGKAFTEEEAKAFDITALLGKECMISVIHKSSTDGTKKYAVISSISTVPKGMKVPPQINETFVFSYDNYSREAFEKLPEYLREKMVKTPEYKQATQPDTTHVDLPIQQTPPPPTADDAMFAQDNSDDLPF